MRLRDFHSIQLVALVACVFLSNVLSVSSVEARDYSDVDWNIEFYENCRPPVDMEARDRAPSIQLLQEGRDSKLKVRLEPGDQGNCRSDKYARDSAPYWERAELRQIGGLSSGESYQIYFTASFDRGFAGRRETFFQIHNWSKECNAAPLAMLQFDKRRLKLQVLHKDAADGSGDPRGHLRNVLANAPTIETLGSGEHSFMISLDLRGTPTVSLMVDLHEIVPPTPVYMRACNDPYVKVGLYRPGEANPGVSEITLDDFQVDIDRSMDVLVD